MNLTTVSNIFENPRNQGEDDLITMSNIFEDVKIQGGDATMTSNIFQDA
jgi:hypothetical protein